MSRLEPPKKKAPTSGSFKIGNRANPHGRPAVEKELRLACQKLGMGVVESLWAMRNDPKLGVAACKELLDRGYGRSAQIVDMTITQTQPNWAAVMKEAAKYAAACAADAGRVVGQDAVIPAGSRIVDADVRALPAVEKTDRNP